MVIRGSNKLKQRDPLSDIITQISASNLLPLLFSYFFSSRTICSIFAYLVNKKDNKYPPICCCSSSSMNMRQMFLRIMIVGALPVALVCSFSTHNDCTEKRLLCPREKHSIHPLPVNINGPPPPPTICCCCHCPRLITLLSIPRN